MPLSGEYEPSPQQWVRDQVERYESSGGTEATTLADTGIPMTVADQPQTSVVRGTGLALENFEVLKRNQAYLR